MPAFDLPTNNDIERLADDEAWRVAVKWPNSLHDVDDLRQEAWIVALRCTKHYDPTRGAAFATYARKAIRGHLNSFAARGTLTASASDRKLRAAIAQSVEPADVIVVDHCSAGQGAGAVRGRSKAYWAVDPLPDPATAAASRQIARVVVQAVEAAIVGLPHGELSRDIILCRTSKSVKEVAAAAGTSTKRVYQTTEVVRRRLSRTLRATWGATQ